MKLDSHCNVGIGTTNAATALTVKSSTNSYGLRHTDGNISLSTYLGGTNGWFGTDSNHNLAFYTNGSNAHMLIDTTGNVGIGTTTVTAKLDVNGDIRIASASKLYVGATATCDSTGCTAAPSDIRYKENVTPLQDSLDNILKIQGVSYDWIDKQAFNDKHQIGFIAQDLEKIYPEVVKTDEKTGLKSVMYDKLVAPLIEAFKTIYGRLQGVERDIASLQEQKADKAETEVLKADNAAKDKKIQKLEQDNAEMKARLDKIEQMLKSK